MAFPITAKYFLRFLHSSTGLTPVFTMCKRADTMQDIVPPAITEVGHGTYYFPWTFTTAADPDIIFEVDGGASIPTEEIRYIGDTLTPRAYYIDEPTSQVVNDVWNDAVDRGAGTKGQYVESVGLPADNSAQPSLFGRMLLHKESVRGDGAGLSNGNSVKEAYDHVTSQTTLVTTETAKIGDNTDTVASPTLFGNIKKARADVLGSPETSIQQIAGTGFNAATDSLHQTALGMLRVLGLTHENSVLDSTLFNPQNNLTQGRLRTYDTKANAQAAGLTGLIAQYTITVTYDGTGQNIQTYLVVRDA